MSYVPLRKVVEKLRLHPKTLRRYAPQDRVETIRDIVRGLNFKRKGLRSLLDRLMRGDQLEIVVACRVRLTRFGFELIEYMVEPNGGKIVVLARSEHCPDSELVQDILAIIHVFSCRNHGLRKSGDKIKKDKDLS